jgi:hypothetical protein
MDSTRSEEIIMAECNRVCDQCGALPGELHREWDDIARCFESGEQLIACSEEHVESCSPSRWDGEYPNIKKCRALGLFIVDPQFGKTEDLNKFASLPKEWNRDSQEWDIPDWVRSRLLVPTRS